MGCFLIQPFRNAKVWTLRKGQRPEEGVGNDVLPGRYYYFERRKSVMSVKMNVSASRRTKEQGAAVWPASSLICISSNRKGSDNDLRLALNL